MITASFSSGVSDVNLIVNVLGRSGIVWREKFSFNLESYDDKKFSIPIRVTKEMAPSSRVVCYYVKSGEIVYDQLVFTVNPSTEHKVCIFGFPLKL